MKHIFCCLCQNFWKKRRVLLILECIFLCHPPYHLFSSTADVFLMNCECLISSLLSFAVGKRFPPGSAPYLTLLWMGSDQNWNQPPYWSAGKVEKGKHWLGGQKWAKKLNCFCILLSPLGWEIDCSDILTFLHRYWSSYWPHVGCWCRDQKAKRFLCFHWEEGSWSFDVGIAWKNVLSTV